MFDDELDRGKKKEEDFDPFQDYEEGNHEEYPEDLYIEDRLINFKKF